MYKGSRLLLIVLVCFGSFFFSSCSTDNTFTYSWESTADRTWAGEFFWANRLQDWQIKNGRMESVVTRKGLPLRTVHILPLRIAETKGSIRIEVNTGIVEKEGGYAGDGLTGLLIGAGGAALDYRGASLIHHTSAENAGILAGITTGGQLHIGMNAIFPEKKDSIDHIASTIKDCKLIINITPTSNENYRLTLEAFDKSGNSKIGEISLDTLPAALLRGNIALVSHGGSGEIPANFWFKSITAKGGKLLVDESKTFGPIAFSMYTLSNNILKLSAQMMPLGETESKVVELQLKENSKWKTIASETFAYPSYNVLFKIPNWDYTSAQTYRLVYSSKENNKIESWPLPGVIRKEPVEKDTLKTISISCIGHTMSGIESGGKLPEWTDWNYDVLQNIKNKWSKSNLYTPENIWFPHEKLEKNLLNLNPDLVFFLGDQVYEFKPTQPDRNNGKSTILDYLYKWYMFGWSMQELLATVPSVSIPDDHDVYHGNLWGNEGSEAPPNTKDWRQGGYTQTPEFVNMVERTQTSHLPDPFDPKPVQRGIGVYFTALEYAGVSFAILEDRKFKSPPGTKETDAQLLGKRQLSFINHWAADWNENTDFKVALTQTLLACAGTKDGKVNFDMDSNGWPSTGRNEALRALRKSFSFMIGGDQHLATVVHHGADEWDDAGYSVITQAIGCVWPRFWQPDFPPFEKDASGVKYLGKYFDAFGNKINVKAVVNPASTNISPIAQNDLAVGYVTVNFIKSKQLIEVGNWPVHADVTLPNAAQYDGWPITISLFDNYKRKPDAFLPMLVFDTITNPFVQIIHEGRNELIYNLRVKSATFQPPVFEKGTYTIRIGKSSSNIIKEMKGLDPMSNTMPQKINL